MTNNEWRLACLVIQEVQRRLPAESNVFGGFKTCETFEQARSWHDQTVREIIAMAQLDAKNDRAKCPLCHHGTANEEIDWLLPLGLTRHLDKCDVLEPIRIALYSAIRERERS